VLGADLVRPVASPRVGQRRPGARGRAITTLGRPFSHCGPAAPTHGNLDGPLKSVPRQLVHGNGAFDHSLGRVLGGNALTSSRSDARTQLFVPGKPDHIAREAVHVARVEEDPVRSVSRSSWSAGRGVFLVWPIDERWTTLAR
jgi:hypothetical protein